MSGLWEYITQKPLFKVLIVGLDNAGKTVTTMLKNVIDYSRIDKSDA